MLKPVNTVTWVTGALLLLLMGIGLAFLILYYRNILLQIRILTGKLMQVEKGDFDAKISAVEMPQNEFSYVFAQFNRMVMRIRQLIASILKEQQLRDQAELRQLQLQINPHFLSNSLFLHRNGGGQAGGSYPDGGASGQVLQILHPE